MKRLIKRFLLKRKGIICDKKSDVNFNMIKTDSPQSKIVNSSIVIKSMGGGCYIEHVVGYGNIELGRYVSISGPGVILHSEMGSIKIGAFSSIAANVSIQEYNHNYNRPTTFAMQYNLFGEKFSNDVITKGDIIIEEDVWIGSNVVILSGVTIGRGSIVGAGSIVTKSTPRYSIVAGNPAKVIRMRFDEQVIQKLEDTKWWTWSDDKIHMNKPFFTNDVVNFDFDKIKLF